jgi:hypothetical protein
MEDSYYATKCGGQCLRDRAPDLATKNDVVALRDTVTALFIR